ncbi:unnamed protein product, partial [Laminaria digitata]
GKTGKTCKESQRQAVRSSAVAAQRSDFSDRSLTPRPTRPEEPNLPPWQGVYTEKAAREAAATTETFPEMHSRQHIPAHQHQPQRQQHQGQSQQWPYGQWGSQHLEAPPLWNPPPPPSP